ncbi:hypothetical protein ACET3Z_013821 [Daucus carota]
MGIRKSSNVEHKTLKPNTLPAIEINMLVAEPSLKRFNGPVHNVCNGTTQGLDFRLVFAVSTPLTARLIRSRRGERLV